MTQRKKKQPPLEEIGIGGSWDGRTLCGFGEDRPEWDRWLETLLDRLRSLQGVAKRIGLDESLPEETDFASELGVNVGSTFLDRECCAGRCIVAWIDTAAIPEAVRAGTKRLDAFEQQLLKKLGDEDYEKMFGG